jgi:CRISPR-associated protein (TIGR03986 family)
MSWIEGTIEEFKGADPKFREARKVRTSPEQTWNDLHFFHLSLARQAGYPDEELAAGRRISFEPDPRADRPRVHRFKPYERRAAPPASADRPASARLAPTRTFLNPYHFIPLAAPAEGSLLAVDEVLAGTLHDRFGGEPGAPRYSGRIVCRLETEGPVVVGAEQPHRDGNRDNEREIWPFGLPDPAAPDDPYRRAPMIPGSTLRGLISSLVEAASCSTLRVLAEQSFTRRAAIRERALSAVGLLREEDGQLKLRPLTLSVPEMTDSRQDPPRERCRVLLNAYTFDRRRSHTEYAPGTFLDRRKPESWSSSRQEYWYMDLNRVHWHWKERGQARFLLGLMADDSPIPEVEWAALSDVEKKHYTRGFLFVLGLDGAKADNLPPDKKHEYFIPYPEGRAWGSSLEIPAEVLAEFQRLAKNAAEISRGGGGGDYPFLPAGRARDANGVVPRAGDLVYFEVDRQGSVFRLSFSAIWRREVAGSLHGAVRLVSPDLVPFDSRRRTHLTLAERLFGFVEADGKRALAGRLRFAHGLVEGAPPQDGWYEPFVSLKILATPKPPSPALYFGHHGYLAKGELNLHKHSPQGRKMYLHHRPQDVSRGSHVTVDLDDKRKLKARARPLKTGSRFLFHVDFENLTREELGYLLYAFQPAESFRHKLGMAKPLGLGRVRIDPLALCYRDRVEGYGPRSLFARKYAAIEFRAGTETWRDLTGPLAHRYRHEAAAVGTSASAATAWPRIEELVDGVRGAVPEKVRSALELLGNPDKVDIEVTYPVLAGRDTEGEHFQWFVANEKENQRALPALVPGKGLPALDRHEPRRR